MSQNWKEQPQRETGLEVDSNGNIRMEVVFYGEAPLNVITEAIPEDIENPVWNGERWVENI